MYAKSTGDDKMSGLEKSNARDLQQWIRDKTLTKIL